MVKMILRLHNFDLTDSIKIEAIPQSKKITAQTKRQMFGSQTEEIINELNEILVG